MSRAKVFTIFILVDLAIIAGVVFCSFQRLPVAKYLVPAIVLFTLNGFWMIFTVLKNTPRRP